MNNMLDYGQQQAGARIPPTPIGGGNPPTTTPGGGGNTTGNTQTPAPPTWGSFGGQGSTPANFGQPMYPWLMPWQGNFTAPMSPTEQGALGGYQNFVQGGMGLNPAGSYLNNVLGGQYLNLNTNPYLQQIQQAEQGLKDYNDRKALEQIGNTMALGGSALSGARLGATSDYMRNSNNAFESMMGQLMNQNYGLERGMMGAAPGQLANLANTAGAGYSQLFGMGALPRSLQQNDLNAQYQDFLRQTGGMQQAFQSPDQQLLSLLYGGGYRGQYQPMYGSSTLDQIAGLLGGQGGLGNIDWGSIANSIGGLFSGGGGTTTDTTGGSTTGADGRIIGYDGPAPATSGPANYYDKNWYLNALTQRELQQQQAINNAQHGPNTTLPAILTLLLSLLPKKSGGGSKFGIGGGPGGGGGGTSGKRPSSQGGNLPFQGVPTEQTPYGSNNPNMYGPYLPPPEQTPYGSSDPNMQGPYLPPPEQTPYGSNDPNMYGPYMPPDMGGFNAGGDYSGAGVDLGGGFVT